MKSSPGWNKESSEIKLLITAVLLASTLYRGAGRNPSASRKGCQQAPTEQHGASPSSLDLEVSLRIQLGGDQGTQEKVR